jgi:hypothetical protein
MIDAMEKCLVVRTQQRKFGLEFGDSRRGLLDAEEFQHQAMIFPTIRRHPAPLWTLVIALRSRDSGDARILLR